MSKKVKKVVEQKKVLDPERKKALKEAFDLFDKDGSGDISINEIYKIMKSFGNKISKAEIKEMIADIDTSGDENLDFEEFCTFFEKVEVEEPQEEEEEPQENQGRLRSKKKPEDEQNEEEGETDEDRVIRAFMTFDDNKSGTITNREFRYILEHLGYQLPRSFSDRVFKESNLDDEGNLNYRDFVNYWKQYPDSLPLVYCVEKADRK